MIATTIMSHHYVQESRPAGMDDTGVANSIVALMDRATKIEDSISHACVELNQLCHFTRATTSASPLTGTVSEMNTALVKARATRSQLLNELAALNHCLEGNTGVHIRNPTEEVVDHGSGGHDAHHAMPATQHDSALVDVPLVNHHVFHEQREAGNRLRRRGAFKRKKPSMRNLHRKPATLQALALAAVSKAAPSLELNPDQCTWIRMIAPDIVLPKMLVTRAAATTLATTQSPPHAPPSLTSANGPGTEISLATTTTDIDHNEQNARESTRTAVLSPAVQNASQHTHRECVPKVAAIAEGYPTKGKFVDLETVATIDTTDSNRVDQEDGNIVDDHHIYNCDIIGTRERSCGDDDRDISGSACSAADNSCDDDASHSGGSANIVPTTLTTISMVVGVACITAVFLRRFLR